MVMAIEAICVPSDLTAIAVSAALILIAVSIAGGTARSKAGGSCSCPLGLDRVFPCHDIAHCRGIPQAAPRRLRPRVFSSSAIWRMTGKTFAAC